MTLEMTKIPLPSSSGHNYKAEKLALIDNHIRYLHARIPNFQRHWFNLGQFQSSIANERICTL